jgi:HEAT repeat protein
LIKIDPENLAAAQTLVDYLLLFEGKFLETRTLFKDDFKLTSIGTIKWRFNMIEYSFISHEIRKILKKDSIRATVKVALEQVIASTKDDETRLRLAKNLGEIDPGNSTAILTLVQLLESTQSHIQRQALNSLGKIGVGNLNAVATLEQLLASTEDEDMRLNMADSLRKIDPSNSTAISILVQLLESTQNHVIRRQALNSLDKIGIGNPNAITALEQLLASTEDEETRRYLAYDLGKIDPGNSTAISTLVKLLESTEDEFVFEYITQSLAEFGSGNAIAIAALEKLLKSPKNLLLRSTKRWFKEVDSRFDAANSN